MFDDLQKKQEGVDDIFADTEPTNSVPENVNQAKTPLNQAPANQAKVGNNSNISNLPNENKPNLDLGFSGEVSKKNSIIKKLFIIIIIFALLGVGAYFVYSKILLPGSMQNENLEEGLGGVIYDNENLEDEDLNNNTNGDYIFEDEIIEDEIIEDEIIEDEIIEDEIIEDEIIEDTNYIDDNLENIIEEDDFSADDLLKTLDSDGDGLSDWDEINIYNTDPYNSDTDGDGLSDWEEIYIFGTDPLNADTDGDGYLDGAEVMNCYNPLGEGEIDPSLFVNPDLFYDRFPNLIDKCNL